MASVTKLVLVSNMMCYGPEPPLGEEIEQRLTLNVDGKAAVTRYGYARGVRYERLQMSRPRCGINEARAILDRVRTAVEDDFRPMVMDVSAWKVVLVFDDGSKIERCGSMVADDGVYAALSASLREALGVPYLFAFDGNERDDSEDGISV